MNETTKRPARATLIAAAGALLTLGVPHAQAQSEGTGTTATAPNQASSPYYLGASQGFTHDSNVYRIPSGPGDNYSSSSLLAGFDQRLSRQRVFGSASVSLNRYQEQTQLNNTSYDLAAGLAWETLYNLSGNLDASLDQHLSAPAANIASPQAVRNLARRQSVSGVGRWGGVSIYTLEGTLGYSSLDYSAPEYVTSESRQEYGSIGLYYRQSPLLRLGVAVRLDRARTPQAFQQPDGTFLSNQVNGRHLDFLADYELTGRLSANARLSYTRQTNSNAASDADFSGVTGDLRLAYRATGKLGLTLSVARQAGFDATASGAPVVPVDTTTPATTPVAGLYENNRVTNSLGLGATYEATSKINVNAGLSYARARVVSTLSSTGGSVGSADVVDALKGATLGVTYAIARPWLLGCNLAFDKRDVSGAVVYTYEATSIGCSARFKLSL
jgi:hypothetical protein